MTIIVHKSLKKVVQEWAICFLKGYKPKLKSSKDESHIKIILSKEEKELGLYIKKSLEDYLQDFFNNQRVTLSVWTRNK